ncbi:MAG TPA: hypothetical protein HA362_00960 [Nanoarchaeota archaeon]|nr:hypothetical protein [Nanoarchaeota archaeon]
MEKPWKIYCFEAGDGAQRVGGFLEGKGYAVANIGFGKSTEEELLGAVMDKRDLFGAVKAVFPQGSRVLGILSPETHHLTYGLSRMAGRQTKKFFYAHIAHNRGWHGQYADVIAHNNFIPHILRNTTARTGRGMQANLVSVGCINNILASVTEREMREGPERLERVLACMPEEAYVSVNLDLLDAKDRKKESGTMSMEGLIAVVQQIVSAKHIIGADIVCSGWAGPGAYAGLAGVLAGGQR